MQAFVQGCHSHGIATVENSWDANAAVIWSVLWHGKMRDNRKVYEHYRSAGKPVICIDVGALHRGQTWKIAVNNINAQGYYGHQENLDQNRPAKLGIRLGTVKSPKPAVLVAAQHPMSLQVQNVDQISWFEQQLAQLRTVTDLPVIVRPHPRAKLDWSKFSSSVAVQNTRLLPNTYDSFDIDYGYQYVMNYNSGAGVQAAIVGATVIVHETSLAAPVSTGVDPQQWLVQICHTEYLIEEIQQALWLKRLGHRLQKQ